MLLNTGIKDKNNMSKQVIKKRSSLNQSLLTPPADFDNKKYAGRWVSERNLNARSDGFEARGFTPYKTKDDKIVRVGDLVWCYMTKEDALYRKQELFDLAKEQITGQQESAAAEDDQLAFELKRAGGQLKTTIREE